MIFFPNYSEKQAPDKYNVFSVLAITKYEELKRIAENASKQRAKNEVEDQFIFIKKNIYPEIDKVMKRKSKYYISYHCTHLNRFVNYLLRKYANIQVHRKSIKKYNIEAAKLKKDDEVNRILEVNHME